MEECDEARDVVFLRRRGVDVDLSQCRIREEVSNYLEVLKK